MEPCARRLPHLNRIPCWVINQRPCLDENMLMYLFFQWFSRMMIYVDNCRKLPLAGIMTVVKIRNQQRSRYPL